MLTLLSLTGLTQRVLFTEPSVLKYVLSVALPLGSLAVLASRRPALLLAMCVVVVAPFGYVADIAGVSLSAFTALLLVSVVATRLRQPVSLASQPARLGGAAVIAALCFLLPVVNGSAPLLYARILISGALTAYVVACEARTPTTRRLLVLAFVGSASLQASLAVWEFVTGHQLNLYGASGGGTFAADYFFNFEDRNRAAAALPDPNSLGNVLAMACPLTLALAAVMRPRVARLAVVGAGVLLVVGLVATLSRMSWIAAGAGTIAALAYMPRGSRFRMGTGLAGALALAVVVALGVGGPALVARYSSISDPTASHVDTAAGDRARLQLQHAAVSVAGDHPVAGVGLGKLPGELAGRVPGASASTHAHNTYFNVAAEAGALGVAALVALALASAADLRRGLRNERVITAGAAGALLSLALTWTTDYTVRNLPVMGMVAVVFGLLASVGARPTPDDPESRTLGGSRLFRAAPPPARAS
jgi:O-antigen ligase